MSWVEEQSWFGLEPDDVEMIVNAAQEKIKKLFLTKKLWTNKLGCHIHLKDMKTSHIKNCINKCKRENWRIYALPILEKELIERKKLML